MKTIKGLLNFADQYLARSSSSPALDAEVLLASALACDRAHLFAHPDRRVSYLRRTRFLKTVFKRNTGIPIAYLIKTKEFYGRNFFVSPRVLIPRPKTEELIATTLTYLKRNTKGRIIDVGTGSGCIAVTLALETDMPVTAIDISRDALRIARMNARTHKVEHKITFIKGDLLDMLETREDLVIVANLPYLRPPDITGDIAHEPRQALVAGVKGIELYQRLEEQIERIARTTGKKAILFSERGNYSNETGVPTPTIEIHTFPGAKAISVPASS